MARTPGACPACGSSRIVSTPLAGPRAVFYCRTCDSSLTTNDWQRQ